MSMQDLAEEVRARVLYSLQYGDLVEVGAAIGWVPAVFLKRTNGTFWYHALCLEWRGKISGKYTHWRVNRITEDQLNKYQKEAYADFKREHGLDS